MKENYLSFNKYRSLKVKYKRFTNCCSFFFVLGAKIRNGRTQLHDWGLMTYWEPYEKKTTASKDSFYICFFKVLVTNSQTPKYAYWIKKIRHEKASFSSETESMLSQSERGYTSPLRSILTFIGNHADFGWNNQKIFFTKICSNKLIEVLESPKSFFYADNLDSETVERFLSNM